nr:hypothetical protein [Tanacetum cinerariifolium]
MLTPSTIATNTEFLNHLQPEWKRYVTIMKQTEKLHDTYYNQLFMVRVMEGNGRIHKDMELKRRSKLKL